MKAPSPLLGFNNNFKHKGQVYHIQTEDSGVRYKHIITHLFADGGRILKSIKTSYASVVDDPAMATIVRDMMKDQHKAMIVALRDGQFDPGGAKEVKLPTTGAFANTTTAGSKATTALPNQPTREASPSGPVPAVILPENPNADHAPVNLAELERAAAAASSNSPIFRPQSDLPPPPANVLGGSVRPRDGGYQSVAPRSHRSPTSRPPAAEQAPHPTSVPRPSDRPPAAPPRKVSSPSNLPPGGTPSRPPTGRYAQTRPASIFATSKPNTASIFGEELISEGSLDEVILSYLAEDLEGEKK
ncbi:MAG: hypothetical protein NVS3B20_14180 [Polyangiales bacterium]